VITTAGAEDAAEVARIVNAAYHAGEPGIWGDGWERTNAHTVAQLIERGEIAVARVDGRVIGTVRVRMVAPDTAELGMLSVDPEAFGTGAGRALLEYAEARFDTPLMQLELLVPHGAPHPSKVRLHEWYSRLGYREVSRRRFDEPLLTAPADLVTYRKRRRAAPATCAPPRALT